jgi:hypothetical protein
VWICAVTSKSVRFCTSAALIALLAGCTSYIKRQA